MTESKQIQTLGDLMDYAAASGRGQEYLRNRFQKFCSDTGKNMWQPETVMLWRSTYATGEDVAKVMLNEY